MNSSDKAHPLFQKHSDVMNSKPDTMEQAIKLLEEVKRRGNLAFQQNSLQEAEVLYSRCIEIGQKEKLKDLHIYYGNRSASRCGMSKLKLALEDAKECIRLNPKWAKGYFRKGQVYVKLKEYGRAYVAFQSVVELEESNKNGKKQMEISLEKAKELGQDYTSSDDQVEDKTMEDVKRDEKTVKKVEVKKENGGVKKNKTEVVKETGDLSNVRGYKKLADGRTTTFFNNEMTEEVKTLIGDIAPKKIEDATSVQIQNVQGGSAWNQGSTFEEKDMTGWAKGKLKDALSVLEYRKKNGPEPDTVVKVCKMSDVEGDASVAVMRGKKRHIFDFMFTLEIEASFGESKKDQATGKLKFTDMSSDSDDKCEAEVLVNDRYHTNGGKLLFAHLKKEKEGLRALIQEQVEIFVAEYQQF